MTILKLSLRGIRSHLGRLALTFIAITLGVGFVSGSFIIADSLRQVFDNIVEQANADVDARVQPVLDDLEFGQEVAELPESLLSEFEALPEVSFADGLVTVTDQFNPFIPVDREGEEQIPTGPPILPFSWNGPREGTEGGFQQVAGQPPSGEGSINIDVIQAEQLDASVGDTFTYLTPTGEQQFTVDGIIDFPAGGAWFLLFDLPTAQVQFDKVGLLDAIDLGASVGTSPEQVIAAVQPLVPAGVDVLSQEEATEQDSEGFDQVISILGNLLLAFALVALFVSLFIIYNTFAILVGQRIREIGMLRAIGATGAQVRGSIVFEALVVGILGSAVGILAGVGVAALIKALFQSQGGFPETGTVISARTIIVSLLVGIVATLISAIGPAFRASKISPIDAMRNDPPSRRSANRRTIIGGVVTALGVGALFLGLFGGGGTVRVLTFIGLGAVFTFVGVAMLSGLFAGPVVRLLGRAPIVGSLGVISGVLLVVAGLGMVAGGLFGLAFGSGVLEGQDNASTPEVGDVYGAPSGAAMWLTLFGAVVALAAAMVFLVASPRALIDGFRLLIHSFTGGSEKKMNALARQNAARNPQRTAATATALMIGLALVTLVSVLGQSLKSSFTEILEDAVAADIFVFPEAAGPDPIPLPEELSRRINEVDGIAAISAFRTADIRVNDETFIVDAYEAATGDTVLDFGLSSGTYPAIDAGGLGLTEARAEDLGVSVGDTVSVTFEDLVTDNLEVAAIFGTEQFSNNGFLVDLELFETHNPDNGDESLGLALADGADAAAVEEEVKAIASQFGQINAANNADFQDQINSQINQLLVLINGLLGLALVVAFFGVVNTIVLSVLERTREIGLLRAVGMTRGQLMSTIRWEAVVVSVFGTILGIALGLLFGWAGVRAIPDQVISKMAVPWGTLAVIVIMGGLIGVLAAYFPARRAAKLDPLEAIATI